MRKKYSYVTYLSTDDYFKGVVGLKLSLDSVKSKYELACIITKDVSVKIIDLLADYGVKIITVSGVNIRDEIKHSIKEESSSYWNNCWDKLNIFNLTQYKKIVYLDADMLVYKNIDDLFDRPNLSACTDGLEIFKNEHNYKFNSGLMVIEPNADTFNKIIKFANSLDSNQFLQDQIMLQRYFSQWNDNAELHLPENYNVWAPHIDKYPEHIKRDIKVVHYIGKIKPFMDCNIKVETDGEFSKLYYKLAGNLYNNIRNKYKYKLSVLIPHYNESTKVVAPMLDSLIVQENVDLFNDIEIIIGNDGVCGENINSYVENNYKHKMNVRTLTFEHSGISATRNNLLKESNGKYVMFCDCDDKFSSAFALTAIFKSINKNPDLINSSFLEEFIQDGEHKYVVRQDDKTFVHGKAMRRDFLFDNNLFWNEDIKLHEDVYFNHLCYYVAKNRETITSPFYVWKSRSGSIARRDKYFVINTYDEVLKSNGCLIEELKRRGFDKEAGIHALCTTISFYYTTQKPDYQTDELKAKFDEIYPKFKVFYNKYVDYINELNAETQLEVIKQLRNNYFEEGLILETTTFNDWILKIIK